MATPNKLTVHCSVDTCGYWNNHFCSAKELLVNNMTGKAKTSDGTCCETFIPKD
ncbi:MAG: DUF1540 domain-containing protein [Candidatus Gastranaerophilaceae bacterium]|nr:DUF1540 domain-containing protein [Clostridia bacterium]